MSWRAALKAPLYLISVLPVLSVFLLKGPGGLEAAPLLAAMLGVLLLQHGIDVLNDVTDRRRRADVERADSWVQAHAGSIRFARLHGLAAWISGAVVGLVSLQLASAWWVLWVAAPLAVLGFLYSWERYPIGYGASSEWITGLCYGPGVFGCLWLLSSGRPGVVAGAGAASYMFLMVAVLLARQPRKVLTDAMAGKRSFAVRFGALAAGRGAKVLFLGFLSALTLAVMLSQASTAAKWVHVASALAVVLWCVSIRLAAERILSGAAVVVVSALVAEAAWRGVVGG